MQNKNEMTLHDQITAVLELLGDAGFSPGTIDGYSKFFKRLECLASSMGREKLDPELADRFISDTSYRNGSKGYCHSRFLYHDRCIRFLKSFIESGSIDWRPLNHLPAKALKTTDFRQHLDAFKSSMQADGLKPNTMDGYSRFVFYFLSYLEDKGYTNLSQVQTGDITFFIVLVCQEHYAPTSIGAHTPGLRRFVQLFPELQPFKMEVPEHTNKKNSITPTYTDEEHRKISDFLSESSISARNKAIALMAFETGLRAVDICNLRIKDVDWKHDVISIVQKKTGKPLILPMNACLGNALAAYLLEERPVSESDYLFLSMTAPHRPLAGHPAIYNVLRRILSESGVEPDGRISGTRMTRHSYASKMLRSGTPLPVIAQALGHSSPNSTMRYLSTDDGTLSACTLPLPKGGAVK